MLFVQCSQCGKKLFYSRLSNGLCPHCYEVWKCAEAEKNHLLEEEARQWIRDFSVHIGNAFQSRTILKSFGVSKIESIRRDCDYILENFEEWKKYEMLEKVLPEFMEDDPDLNNYQRCSLFPNSILRKNDPVDFEAEFSKLKKDADKIALSCLVTSYKAYDYSIDSRVAGVTFKNEDGRKRQAIIRKMGKGYKDNDRDAVTLERYLFENEDAIAVKLEGSQIGNIPRDDLPYLLENWDNYFRVDAFEVIGYDTLGVDLRIVFRGVEK